MKKRLLLATSLALPTFFFGACADESNVIQNQKTHQSQLQEAWDSRNAPENMGYDYLRRTYNYETRLGQLPAAAKLKTIPWSSGYWPTYLGGLTFRLWSESSNLVDLYGYNLIPFQQLRQDAIAYLSPIEKLDIYLGNTDYRLTRQERERTQILRTVPGSGMYDPRFSIARWEGLCHAWAPAAYLFSNPRPVTLRGPSGASVHFGSADIQGLLVHYLHYNEAQTKFLGGRCNLDFGQLQNQLRSGAISYDQYRAALSSAECRDTNAGAFHIVLANQIGRLNESFVVDKTRDLQVWNQPVYAYSSRVLNQRNSATAGAAPGTVSEVDVETQMTYIVETAYQWEGQFVSESLRDITYRYRLELDRSGRIIGGDWYDNGSGTFDDRPDFLWTQSLPEARTAVDQAILSIYRQSLGGMANTPASSEPHRPEPSTPSTSTGNSGSTSSPAETSPERAPYLNARLSWSHRYANSSQIVVHLEGTVLDSSARSGRLTFYDRQGKKYVYKDFPLRAGNAFFEDVQIHAQFYVGASFLVFDASGRSLGGEIYEFSDVSIPTDDLIVSR